MFFDGRFGLVDIETRVDFDLEVAEFFVRLFVLGLVKIFVRVGDFFGAGKEGEWTHGKEEGESDKKQD